jgi:hypothetical protein
MNDIVGARGLSADAVGSGQAFTPATNVHAGQRPGEEPDHRKHSNQRKGYRIETGRPQQCASSLLLTRSFRETFIQKDPVFGQVGPPYRSYQLSHWSI